MARTHASCFVSPPSGVAGEEARNPRHGRKDRLSSLPCTVNRCKAADAYARG
jgi:hypothetical protein